MFIQIFVLERVSPIYLMADTVILAALDAILNKTKKYITILCFQPNTKLLGDCSGLRPGYQYPHYNQICIPEEIK